MCRTLLTAVVLASLAMACSAQFAPKFVESEDCADISREPLRRTEVILHFESGRQAEVDAEVAATSAEHLQGLMCRSEVPPGAGMLFLIGSERTGEFWMFNTYVDLDIAYIAADGTIADLKRMTSCRRNGETRGDWSARCSAASAGYAPARAYTATLELPTGWLESVAGDGDALARVTWQ
jgi:uncharacterized membrane protein (UPF0127 family)